MPLEKKQGEKLPSDEQVQAAIDARITDLERRVVECHEQMDRLNDALRKVYDELTTRSRG